VATLSVTAAEVFEVVAQSFEPVKDVELLVHGRGIRLLQIAVFDNLI
jgi:hypothetical protein